MLKNNNKVIVSIDGNIGSGKSTFIKKLREKYGDNPEIYFVDEPVKEWEELQSEDGNNLVENFYADKKRYAYIFQNFAYISRLKRLYNALKTNAKIIVTERSVESDRYLFAKMLYEGGLLNKLEWDVYLSWYGFMNIKVDKIIYIRTTVDNCMNRIKMRHRSGEDLIERSYIDNLNKKHEEWLSDRNNVITLDGNMNIFEDNVFESHLNHCSDFFPSSSD